MAGCGAQSLTSWSGGPAPRAATGDGSVGNPASVTGPRTVTPSAKVSLPPGWPRGALAARGDAPVQAWSRCHLNSRLFPPVPGSRPPARPLGAPPHRDSRPMLPAAGKAAPFGTTRRTAQRRRSRRPQLARRRAALRRSSCSYIGGGHRRAANENRTCWRPRQREGESGRKLLSPQRSLSAGGRTAPAAPKDATWAGFSLRCMKFCVLVQWRKAPRLCGP